MSRRLPAMAGVDHGRLAAAGESLCFHCSYVNYWVQKTILLVDAVQPEELMERAAAAVAYRHVKGGADELQLSTAEEKLRLAGDIFSEFGLGIIDFAGLNRDGGEVVTPTSHYGQCFASIASDKFRKPQNIFDRGYIAGAAAAAFGLPLGAYRPTCKACHSLGDDKGLTELKRCEPPLEIAESPGVAPPATTPIESRQVDSNIDASKIFEGLQQLSFSGNEEGLVPRFGVMFTCHWNNYYGRIMSEFQRRLWDVNLGDYGALLLQESGHTCAFFTLGGLMSSPEFDTIAVPMCKTREDWVIAATTFLNAFGVGFFSVEELSAERAVFRVHDDPESVAYLQMYGKSPAPISHITKGVTAGVMNIVYAVDIASKPSLTPELYMNLLENPKHFRAEQTKCLAQDDPYSEFVVTRCGL